VSARVDLNPVLRFLAQLKKNNDRAWFQAHRDDFEAAGASFEAYVAELIEELTPTEGLRGLTPKDCIYRLYRDLRFSKDKSPYKTYMSAVIGPGGRKSSKPGYYVHLAPGGQSLLAAGWYEPEPAQLASFRGAIDRDVRPWKRIVNNKTFRKYLREVEGERLATAPKGYPRDHPQIDLLKLKQVMAIRRLTDTQVRASGIVRETVATFKAMKPFLAFLETLG
jgi:uncharacterized protein (TIGR02453 family)